MKKIAESLTDKIGFLVITGLLVYLGLLQGLQSYQFHADLFFGAVEMIFLDAVISSLGFAAFIAVSSIIFVSKTLKTPEKTPGSDKKITAIIPTYKDYGALYRSVESLLESNYDNLEIIIVCEEEDDKGIEKAEEFSERENVYYLVNGFSKTKSGAVNYGVKNTDSDHIAVFDADQEVDPNFLPNAAKKLEKSDAVNGRHIPRPKGIIESLAYYESVIFTYISRQLLYILTGFRLIGSRDLVIERETFEDLGGYDPEMLTEDFDLTHRAYKEDIKVESALCYPSTEEASHSLKDWWGQRKRWMKGYFQVFHKLLRESYGNYRGYRSLTSLIICGASLIGSILMLTIASKFVILMLLGAEMIYLGPIAVIIAFPMLVKLYDTHRNKIDGIGLEWILIPLIFPLFSIITVKAFVEFIIGEETGWYRIDKNSK